MALGPRCVSGEAALFPHKSLPEILGDEQQFTRVLDHYVTYGGYPVEPMTAVTGADGIATAGFTFGDKPGKYKVIGRVVQ